MQVVQDIIEKLKGLQEVLSKRFGIEAEIKNLPKALSTKTELVNRMKRSYIEKNEEYEATRQRIAELRERMLQAEREREQYEQQMDLIKTQREYEALDKEIREASEREQTLRKDLQREERVLQEMSEGLEREENLIKQQEEELQEEQRKIKSETEAKEKQLKELKKDENRLTPGLDEELLFKFERILRSKEGEGIVPLRKGVCTGCQMILPNQFVNDVRAGESILFCPYCSKIVFYVDTDEDSLVSDEESESLADVIESFVEEDEEGLDLESILDEEPLEMNEGDDEEEVEEEDEIHPDDEGEEEEEEEFDDEEEEEPAGDFSDDDDDEEEEDDLEDDDEDEEFDEDEDEEEEE
jgi:uncharacterized protein